MVKDLFVAQKSATAGAKTELAKADPAKPSAKPEPAKVAAKAEVPAKAEAPAKPEPAKVAARTEAPPKSEAPAKVEPSAKSELPVKPEVLAKAEVPAKAAKPAAPGKAVPAASGEGKVAVTAALDGWAAAWSAKDVKGYLSYYAPDFETPGGEARAAWEKSRTERIEKPKSIEVSVKVNSVVTQGDEATAVVVQSYKSDTLKANSTKTFKLVRVGDKWLIKQERVGG
jgi:ketosteroid isomerase-like protein